MSAQDTQDAQDTSVSEAADTSTNEETDDTEFDDLSDSEVNFDDGDDTEAETDQSDDTADSDEATDETDDEDESFDDDEESVDDSKKDEATDEVTKPTPEEAAAAAEDAERKRLNNEAAQKRIAQREAQVLADKKLAQQEYLDGAKDDQELALRQLQVDAYNNRIESNTNKLSVGIDKAVASIDLFRTGTQLQKMELADSLDEFESLYVRKDSNGDPVEVTGDVVEFLQRKAASIKRIANEGAQQQVRDKSNQRKRTLKTPSRAPKKAKADPLEDGFDEEAAKP